jgi:hypothetical protein
VPPLSTYTPSLAGSWDFNVPGPGETPIISPISGPNSPPGLSTDPAAAAAIDRANAAMQDFEQGNTSTYPTPENTPSALNPDGTYPTGTGANLGNVLDAQAQPSGQPSGGDPWNAPADPTLGDPTLGGQTPGVPSYVSPQPLSTQAAPGSMDSVPPGTPNLGALPPGGYAPQPGTPQTDGALDTPANGNAAAAEAATQVASNAADTGAGAPDGGSPDGSGDPGGGGPSYAPVILDLSGQGIKITPLSSSNAFLELANDGYAQRIAAPGAGEGMPVYDPSGGMITQANQVEFTLWDPTASTDLQALEDVFDTSARGYMTRHDSRSSESLEKCSSNKANRSRGISSSASLKIRSSMAALLPRIRAPRESRRAVNAKQA